MDDASRLALEANNDTTTLRKGQTVHVDGLPYELMEDVLAYSATTKVIREALMVSTDEPKDPTPDDVIKMPLAEFEQRFGFRPVDELEKKFFATTGKRPDQFQRDAIEAGVLGDVRHGGVVME